MSDFSTDYGNAVIVPISVEAMHLGKVDVGKVELAGPYADFSRLTVGEYRANRIDSLEIREASEADVGVHLQWMLPPPFHGGVARDSSTKGGGPQDQVDFRPAPNRWLVTRFPKTRAGQKALPPETWVIESDFCTFEPQWNGVSVPMEPCKRQAVAYLGRCCRLENWNPRGPAQGTERQLGWKLTAVGWGDPGFVSYYPSCRNVFGFHDPLLNKDGLPLDGIEEASYAVLGWYDQPEDDILSARSRANPLFAPPPWGRTDGGPMEAMLTSLYRGYAVSVPIDAGGQNETHLARETTRIVLGNSTQETVAALLATDLCVHKSERFSVERIINGRLAGLDESMPALDNDASHVDDDLHMLRFLASDGGKNWSVRVKPLEKRETEVAEALKLTKIAEEAKAPLPPEILSALTACNTAQRERDYSRRLWEARRRRIRDDLSLLEMMTWDPKSLPIEAGRWSAIRVGLRRRFERDMEAIYRIDLPYLEGRLSEAMRRLDLALATASPKETLYEIHSVPAPRFWQPRDPVILLKSPEICASSRYGKKFRLGMATLEDLAKVPTSRLPCTPAAALPAPTDPVFELQTFERTPHPEALWRLLSKAATLLGHDPNRKIADGPSPAELARQKFLQADPTRSGRPVFFRWTARYLPTLAESATTRPYEEDAVDRHWRFDSSPHKHAELRPRANAWNYRPVEIEGIALANGRVSKALLDRAGEQVPKASPADGHHVSFTLSGFHDHLLMRRPAFSLPFKNRARLLHLREIPDWLTNEQRGDSLQPDPAYPDLPSENSPEEPEFSPLRAGGLELVKLEMIDTFGRVREVPLEADTVLLAASLTPQNPASDSNSTIALLPPRLCLPARLAFRLRSSAGSDDVSSLSGTASPVCGWIIPSHLEKGLIFCGPDGDIKGILRERGTGKPVFLPMPGKKGANLHPQLESLKSALLDEKLILSKLRKSLEAEVLKIVPEQRQDEGSIFHLMGRPLAVVSAEMGIDLQGDLAPRRQILSATLPVEDEPDFLKVRVPVMLGDATRSNDGLAGFFLAEPGEGFAFTKLWLPGEPVDHPSLRIADHGRDRRVRLLLIMDPQAPVHATTGLFPVKPISLPPAHFEAAQKRMSVIFTAGPMLLTGEKEWTLPLPPFEHETWHWAENSPPLVPGDPWTALTDVSQLPAQTDLPSAEVLKSRLWFTLRATTITPPPSTKETRPS